jgi:hypothetical protein
MAGGEAPVNLSAREHVAEAHRRLVGLRGKVGQHPELEEAIEKLALALNQLTLSTGGML